MNRLKDRVALITGGTRGIGLAIARAFLEEGARVIVVSRKAPAVAEAVEALTEVGAGRVFGRSCHVGHADDILATLAWCREEVGLVDTLVNNAGTNPYFGPFLGVSRQAWEKTFEVNLIGAFELCRGVAKGLLEAGRPGAILNVSSILGQGAAPLQGVYGMTKAALISMTQTMAVEWGQAGIRVNALAPGLVDTKLAAAIVHNDALAEVFNARTAAERPATPEELAGAAVFLCSDEATYITGHTLNVDSGYRTR